MKFSTERKPVWFTTGEAGRLGRFLFRRTFGRYSKFYVHMFIEDCSHVIPYGDRQGSAYFELDTNDDELAMQIISAVDTRYQGRHLDDAMRSFFESTVQQLLLQDRVFLYFDITCDEQGSTQIHVIEPNPGYVIPILGWRFQYVPAVNRWPVDESSRRPQGQLRIIARGPMMEIRLPRHLRRLCKKLMSDLDRLSDLNHPDLEKLWKQPTLENPNPRGGPFDFSDFRRRFEVTLFRVIHPTGWTARDYSGEEKSDFFNCINRLRFKRFQTRLRDAILQQFNSQIRRIFADGRPAFQFQVKAAGLPTREEIDELERQLYAGEISFRELIQRT